MHMSIRGDTCDCDVIHEEIVSCVRTKMLSDDTFNTLTEFLKAVGDSTRVRILWALDINEMCVCDLAFLLGMTKSAISHQLHALKQANLVKFRKDGKNAYYSLADEHVKDILELSLSHVTE